MKGSKLENYEVVCKIGEGAYGAVFKARHKPSGTLCALKRVRVADEDEGVPRAAVREIALLKHVEHPNVVRLLGVLHYGSYFYLVLELAAMDLKRFLGERAPLSLPTVKAVAAQLLRGLAELHRLQILHRDLKPQNVLVDEEPALRVRIADLGLARAANLPAQLYTTEVTTLWYRAPEVLLGCQTYTDAIDVWSVGCIVGELVRGAPLFPAADARDALQRQVEALGFPADWPGAPALPHWPLIAALRDWAPAPLCMLLPELDAAGLDFVAALLAMDPARRPSAAAALQHPWLADCNC